MLTIHAFKLHVVEHVYHPNTVEVKQGESETQKILGLLKNSHRLRIEKSLFYNNVIKNITLLRTQNGTLFSYVTPKTTLGNIKQRSKKLNEHINQSNVSSFEKLKLLF